MINKNNINNRNKSSEEDMQDITDFFRNTDTYQNSTQTSAGVDLIITELSEDPKNTREDSTQTLAVDDCIITGFSQDEGNITGVKRKSPDEGGAGNECYYSPDDYYQDESKLLFGEEIKDCDNEEYLVNNNFNKTAGDGGCGAATADSSCDNDTEIDCQVTIFLIEDYFDQDNDEVFNQLVRVLQNTKKNQDLLKQLIEEKNNYYKITLLANYVQWLSNIKISNAENEKIAKEIKDQIGEAFDYLLQENECGIKEAMEKLIKIKQENIDFDAIKIIDDEFNDYNLMLEQFDGSNLLKKKFNTLKISWDEYCQASPHIEKRKLKMTINHRDYL